jgi:hypothetical protein
MEIHEQERCICNPVLRACPTCEHNGYEPSEDPDYESGYPGYQGGHFCSEDHLENGEKIRRQCPFWTPLTPAQPIQPEGPSSDTPVTKEEQP